ncbi:hypothetical protein ALC53_02561 [Atta colombica]|uniref:Uncharacterized protein n=1 Tax=Atta colombica TaxID=520822 RepID=A0A195BQE8_9HYME|nr:hypothetical protein ALC53_02561 [Atta colombica]
MSRGTCRHHAAGIEDCAHAARTYADLCKGALTGVVAAYPHAYGDTYVRTTQTQTHSCNAHGWRRVGVSEGSPYLHEQAKDKSGTCPFSRRTAHLPDVKDDGSRPTKSQISHFVFVPLVLNLSLCLPHVMHDVTAKSLGGVFLL